jgi:cytochrome o ubiquinol oxidase subunit 1
MKARGHARPVEGFRAILMPKNTPTGLILAGLSFTFAVAMIWYVWWLAAASLIGVVAVAIRHSFNYDREFHIPAEEVTAVEGDRTRRLAALGA